MLQNQSKESKIDLSVLIIFFARPEPLFKVFEQIKLARPSKLYLYQDGPRENRPDDVENILLCRKIVEDIDWNCEVHKMYQEKNYGVDPSEYIAQKWMFSTEEYGVVLEDDDVAALNFFPYCKELLERYKDDKRIGIICGMNQMEVYQDTPDSYIFTKSGSITGWATWKRNIDLWDSTYKWLDDPHAHRVLKGVMGDKDYTNFIKVASANRESGKEHYESILGACFYLNNHLNIVPKYNLISNIGIGMNAAHGATSMEILPKGIRGIFFMKTYEIELPLSHPKYIMEDVNFRRKLDRIMANGYPLVKFYRALESGFRRLSIGDFENLKKGFIRRLTFNGK